MSQQVEGVQEQHFGDEEDEVEQEAFQEEAKQPRIQRKKTIEEKKKELALDLGEDETKDWRHLESAELTVYEKEKAERIFRDYDDDGSDTIAQGELRNVLKTLNVSLAPDQYEKYVAKVWALADEDNDGVIGLDEFLVLFSKVFTPSSRFGTAMRTAAARGQCETVKELVSRGCDPNHCDGNGWTALHHAAEFGRTDIVNLIAEMTPREELNVDAKDNSGWTPLMNACANGHRECIQALLGLGARVQAANYVGRTCLHWAACKGQDETVRYLVSHAGAAANATDNSGWSALHCAALHGHSAVVRTLLLKNANPGLRDRCGYTALKYADGAAAAMLEEALAGPLLSARLRSN